MPLRFLVLLIVCSALLPGADGTVSVAGVPRLRLSLPDGWMAVAHGDTTALVPPERSPEVRIRALPGATAVEVPLSTLSGAISDDVSAFVLARNEAVSVAGRPAQWLAGNGTGAADAQPCQAEITVFAMAGTVYLCVSHAAGNAVGERRDVLAGILDTAVAMP
jgi:hypothetical protein